MNGIWLKTRHMQPCSGFSLDLCHRDSHSWFLSTALVQYLFHDLTALGVLCDGGQICLPGDYKRTDTIFTSLSNSWANVVPGEGHMIMKQGNPAVISKQSHTGVKAVTHVPVVRSPGVFKDNLWWHGWDRVHLNTVTAEVFWIGKVSAWWSKYLVDPFSLSDSPLFQVVTLKYLSPNVTQERRTDHGCLMRVQIWFLNTEHTLILTQPIVLWSVKWCYKWRTVIAKNKCFIQC